MIAPSMRSEYLHRQGNCERYFWLAAIHVRDAGKEETPSLKNIFIDIGAESKKEVEARGVHVGCVITFQDELIELGKNFLVGRALDKTGWVATWSQKWHVA
ncbi:MAG: hypothetical protein WDN75_14980 [Bacteroidota bacterium]